MNSSYPTAIRILPVSLLIFQSTFKGAQHQRHFSMTNLSRNELSLQTTPTADVTLSEQFYTSFKPITRPESRLKKTIALLNWNLAFIAQMLCIVFAVLYYTSVYTAQTGFKTSINRWWGVNPAVKNSGHSEMTGLTYLLLACGAPVFIGSIFYTLSHQSIGLPTGIFR